MVAPKPLIRRSLTMPPTTFRRAEIIPVCRRMLVPQADRKEILQTPRSSRPIDSKVNPKNDVAVTMAPARHTRGDTQMSEREATQLGAGARLSRTVHVVADRSGRAVPLFAEGGHPLRSLAVPTMAVWQPPDVDGNPSGPESVSTDITGREHGSSRGAENLVGVLEPTSEGATRQDLVGAERVLIIDDCTLFREILAAILAAKGIAVTSTAWDLSSLVTAFEETDANLALLNMATRRSHLLVRAAMDISPGARIIVLGTPEEDEQKIIACAEAGVAGYHMRGDSLDDLIMLIHNVAGGKSICPPRVSAILLRRLSRLASQRQPAGRELALTTREAQILKMLELGRSNRDIAVRLNIAVHTVKNHVHNLLSKLGVNTRAEAAALSRTISSERGARKN
jgi:DNA-binding NarL/FixJ family response regulator